MQEAKRVAESVGRMSRDRPAYSRLAFHASGRNMLYVYKTRHIKQNFKQSQSCSSIVSKIKSLLILFN